MKTIRMVFVGGPECGNTRVVPDNIPAIKIPMPPVSVTWTVEGTPSPLTAPPHYYQYVATDEKDSNKHRIFRYVGEQ